MNNLCRILDFQKSGLFSAPRVVRFMDDWFCSVKFSIGYIGVITSRIKSTCVGFAKTETNSGVGFYCQVNSEGDTIGSCLDCIFSKNLLENERNEDQI